MNDNLLTYKEAERIHGELLTATKAAKLVGARNGHLLNTSVVNYGQFQGCYLKVGMDVEAPEGSGGHKVNYLYIKEKMLNSEKVSLMSLVQISKELGLSHATLQHYSQQGLLNKGRYGHRLFSLEWVNKNIEEIQLMKLEKMAQSNYVFETYRSLIERKGGKHIIEAVDEFLLKKVRGEKIFIGEEIRNDKKMDKPEKNLPLQEKLMHRLVYKLICGRSGIKDYAIRNHHSNFRSLTEEEIAVFDAAKFLIWDINTEDLNYMSEGIGDNYLSELLSSHFVPFLYFYLEKLKQKRSDLKEMLLKGQFDDVNAVNDLNAKIDLFLEKIRSFRLRIPSKTQPEAKEAVYLQRKDLSTIFTNLSMSVIQDKLKWSTILMFFSLTGLRPDEVVNFKVSNLILDNYGFPKKFILTSKQDGASVISESPDNTGFGVYHVKYSKGSYSDSPRHGNYLAPVLLEKLSDYLRWAYAKYPKFNKDSYLFPVSLKHPNVPYGSGMESWMYRNRETLFSFLPREQRKLVTLYVFRRSIADWMVFGTNLPNDLERFKIRVGQLHMRHNIEGVKDSKDLPLILSTYANSNAGALEYFTIIQMALNFPLDPSFLEEWEYKSGLRQPVVNQTPNNIASDSFENRNLSIEKQQQVDYFNDQINSKLMLLDELKMGHKKIFVKKYGITRQQWLLREPQKMLEKEVKDLRLIISQLSS